MPRGVDLAETADPDPRTDDVITDLESRCKNR
jgi:hypothetical protein